MDQRIFYIYCDEGTSETCVAQWMQRIYEYNTVSDAKTRLVYKTVRAEDIINNNIVDGFAVIIPGGRDVPYHTKLSPVGNTNIKQFVTKGGLYIGSCAGAYYAHNDIRWHNTTETIVATRELQFIHGSATGPLITPYSPNTDEGLKYVAMEYHDTLAKVYYKGGPHMFVDDTTEIIARFTVHTQTYPAIIKKTIGKGTVLCFSVHLEYTDEYLQSINAPPCAHRNKIFVDIFNSLV